MTSVDLDAPEHAICSYALAQRDAEIRSLRGQLAAAINRAEELRDNPELDATDAAHPAWWRGHDHTARRVGEELQKARERAELAQRTMMVAVGQRDELRDAARRLLYSLPVCGICTRPGTRIVEEAPDESPRYRCDKCQAGEWLGEVETEWAAAVRELAKVLEGDAAVARKGGGT